MKTFKAEADGESKVKYILTWMGLFILSFATTFAWGLILQIFNILPLSKLPIQEYPLW